MWVEQKKWHPKEGSTSSRKFVNWPGQNDHQQPITPAAYYESGHEWWSSPLNLRDPEK